MDSSEFLQKLSEFKCRRCNECCKKPGFVYLEKGAEETIAEHLGLDPFQFVNLYCDLADRKRLVLKKKEDESCIFLREYGCAIHEVKPAQCKDFPVKWRTDNSFSYCEGLKKIFPQGKPKEI